MNTTNDTIKLNINLSPFKPDALTGRRTFLGALYISLFILLFFPLMNISLNVSALGAMAGVQQEAQSKLEELIFAQKAVAWFTLLLGSAMPIIIILLRRSVSKILKVVALVLFAPALLFAIRMMNDQGSRSDFGGSGTWGPTIWAALYFVALIAGVVGIARLGRKQTDVQAMAQPSNH